MPRVGVGVEQRVDAVAAMKPGAEPLEVVGPHHALVVVRVQPAVRGRRQDRHVVPQPSEPLGHRGGTVGARIAARRIEVGDEQKVHAVLLRLDAIASA